MSRLLTPNPIYKPFYYPWAYEAWSIQQKIHWLPEEVPLSDDIKDWNSKLTDAERNLLTQIFRFFTQSDIEVNDCYMENYGRIFKPTEIKMMLASFSNMETIHVAAYSHLLDTIGMPEATYKAFLEFEEMKSKWDYLKSFNMDNPYNTALTMAVFGAFTEGLQLFASFAILLNFPRFNKMRGMGQIISWSVRDETLHTLSIIKLFKTFVDEHPDIDQKKLNEDLLIHCQKVVFLEDAFIDLAFEAGEVQGLTPMDIKNYIRYIANRRLEQLGIQPFYDIHTNPLPWLDGMLNGLEHTNFFENRATEYAKAATIGTWDEAFQ
jgi:ribonucleoside-diphosphate reductase beta chain